MGCLTSKSQHKNENDLVVLILASSGSTAIDSYTDRLRGGTTTSTVEAGGWTSETFKFENIQIETLRNTSTFRRPVMLIVPQPFEGRGSKGINEYLTVKTVSNWLSQKKVPKHISHIDHILLFPGSLGPVKVTHPIDMTLSPLIGLCGNNVAEIKRKAFIVSDPGQQDAIPETWQTLVEERRSTGTGPISLKDETREAALEVLRVIITS